MSDLPNPTRPLSPVSLPRGSLHRPYRSNGAAHPVPGGGVEVVWARHLDEVRQAQRLRYEVFATEMGARLKPTIKGHDIDIFDDFCEHLLVRDLGTGQVVGTYRVLTPEQARRAGCTYSDTEFDLTRLSELRPRMVELGRSCVHAQHRHGGVIMGLWGGLVDFMARNRTKLERNQRLPFVYATWEKFGLQKQKAIRSKAAQTLKAISENKL